MEELKYGLVILVLLFGSGLSFAIVRSLRLGFYINTLWIILGLLWAWGVTKNIKEFVLVLLVIGLPLFFLNILWYVFFPME
ncbi:hypothetical protein, partial [Eudoraea sp.]|uniref:hypothetical protein n=1 Tax=Eudoraea sp. TaxID=1979955 RepID=UPI003C720DA7